MNVSVQWALQKSKHVVTWGGVISIGNASLLLVGINNTIKILSTAEVKLCTAKLSTRAHSACTPGFQKLRNYTKTAISRTLLLHRLTTAYQKARFIRERYNNNSDITYTRLPVRPTSRYFPMNTVISNKATYTYSNAACLGGDCKIRGTSELVKNNNVMQVVQSWPLTSNVQ